MTKKFLLEQCRRSRLIDYKETINEAYWINHDKGHEALRSEFEEILKSMAVVNRKYLKIWLRAEMQASEEVLDELDAKYDYTLEGMSPEDDEKYSYYEGRDCMADLLMRIVMKKEYIWKI